jgi:hypothetical protein
MNREIVYYTIGICFIGTRQLTPSFLLHERDWEPFEMYHKGSLRRCLFITCVFLYLVYR